MIKITDAKLREILDLHEKWLFDKEGGKKADLSYCDLRFVNLRFVNLSRADLRYANLSGCNVFSCNLSYANLRNCILNGAYFINTKLHGIYTNKNCFHVSGVGSENKLVSYFVKEDIVVCGWWECKQGNTLENFKKRVESVYGEKGETPNELFYGEYQDVIKFFESRRKHGL